MDNWSFHRTTNKKTSRCENNETILVNGIDRKEGRSSSCLIKNCGKFFKTEVVQTIEDGSLCQTMSSEGLS